MAKLYPGGSKMGECYWSLECRGKPCDGGGVCPDFIEREVGVAKVLELLDQDDSLCHGVEK